MVENSYRLPLAVFGLGLCFSSLLSILPWRSEAEARLFGAEARSPYGLLIFATTDTTPLASFDSSSFDPQSRSKSKSDDEAGGLSQPSLYLPLNFPLVSSDEAWSDRRRPSYQDTIRNIEQHILRLVNQHRIQQGLPPLQLDERLSEQARQHSEAMATRRVAFGHGGFPQRVDRIEREIRYRRIGENIAFNQGMMNPAQRALRGWLNSTTHRNNINGRYDLTGIGVARDRAGGFYITQIFLRRR